MGHPFDNLIRRKDDDVRLAEAALLFSRDLNPRLEIPRWLTHLDFLATRVDRQNPRSNDDRLMALREILVVEEGFRGNRDDYYDPRNSFLHEVLERRTGIPISLTAVWLDIGRTLDWPVCGIGLPGHFIMRCGPLLIDPFGDGRTLSLEECGEIASATLGKSVQLRDRDLEPAPVRAILTRMLTNLRMIYLTREDWNAALFVVERMLAVHPDSEPLTRQLAMIRSQLAQLN